VKAVVTSNTQYQSRFRSFAGSMQDLYDNGYIDAAVANPTKAGFTFDYQSSGTTFEITADPSVPGESGNRYFFADDTGVIRFSYDGTASDADDPL